MIEVQGESTTDLEKLKAGGKLNFDMDENVTVIRGAHRGSKGKVVGVGATRSSINGRVFVEARAIVNLCGKAKEEFYHFKDSEIRNEWLDDLDELDDNSSKSPIVDYIEYKDLAFWVQKEYEEEREKNKSSNTHALEKRKDETKEKKKSPSSVNAEKKKKENKEKRKSPSSVNVDKKRKYEETREYFQRGIDMGKIILYP